MGTHPIFESDFDCLTAAMLSRLNPARQTVRVLSLAKAGGSEVAKSAPAAQWASPEEQAQIAANFQGKQAAAGISAWNVVPDNIADPALKAGLGMIVSFNDFIPQRMAGRCSDAVLDEVMDREGGVVWLNNGIRHLGGWHDGESGHDSVWVLFSDLGDEEGSHTGSGTTTEGVGDL